MKKSKLFGAMALSAALAMGTLVPAFAAPTASVEGDGAFGDGQNGTTLNAANTDVKVLAEVTQLNAEIPLTVSVVADMTGGALKASPTGDLGASTGTSSNTGYRIVNRTLMPIKIVDVKATQGSNDKWTYEPAAFTDLSNYGGGNKWGRIHLTINKDTEDMTGGTAINTSAVNLGWSVPAGTPGANNAVNPGLMGLKLGGMTSYINSDTEIDTANAGNEAVTLTYTIAIDPQTAGN